METNKKDVIEQIEASDRVARFFKSLIPYVIIIFVVAIIRTFFVTPVRVNGSSMDPYLKDGEILILNKTDRSYDRFDIIVTKVNGTNLIKRVIGLPGENIEYRLSLIHI